MFSQNKNGIMAVLVIAGFILGGVLGHNGLFESAPQSNDTQTAAAIKALEKIQADTTKVLQDLEETTTSSRNEPDPMPTDPTTPLMPVEEDRITNSDDPVIEYPLVEENGLVYCTGSSATCGSLCADHGYDSMEGPHAGRYLCSRASIDASPTVDNGAGIDSLNTRSAAILDNTVVPVDETPEVEYVDVYYYDGFCVVIIDGGDSYEFGSYSMDEPSGCTTGSGNYFVSPNGDVTVSELDPSIDPTTDTYTPCYSDSACELLVEICDEVGGTFEWALDNGGGCTTFTDGGNTDDPTVSTYSNFSNHIRYGDVGAEVVNLQRVLARLGYYKGIVDGKYGPGTTTAVKAFQRANGKVLTTGRLVGKNTVVDLNEAVREINTAGNNIISIGGGTGVEPENSSVTYCYDATGCELLEASCQGSYYSSSNPEAPGVCFEGYVAPNSSITTLDPVKDVAWVIEYIDNNCTVYGDNGGFVGQGSAVAVGSTVGCKIDDVVYLD